MKRWRSQIKELLDTRTDFVILLDSHGTIRMVNQQWTNFCIENGLSSACREIGMDYLAFLASTGKEEEVKFLAEILKSAPERNLPMVSVHTNNGIKWLSVKALPFIFPDETRGAILYQELAQFKSIDMATEEVMESISDAVCIFDSEMRITYANAMTEKLVGSKYEELIGKDLRMLFPEATECLFYETCLAVKEQKQPMEMQYYSETAKFWVDTRIEPMKGNGLVVFFQDISERKTIETQLKEYDYVDQLTGLLNRKKIQEELKHLVAEKIPFSLLYMNLNKLKYVNSLHSHQAGDELLKMVTSSIQPLLGEQDLFGRLDGDEFVIVRQTKGQENLSDLPEAVSKVFNKPFPIGGSKPISINVSIGVVNFPEISGEVDELLDFGETAMHEAKKQMGSTYVIFRSHMNIGAARRRTIERGLNGNLKELGVYFVLQPQMDAASGKLHGAEMLARWNHPELGMISPEEFIKVAEETETIEAFTYYLVHELLGYLKERIVKHACTLRTAINVTPSLLANKDFFSRFFLLLDQYEIPAELIEFEITESIELTYSEATLQNLILCRSKGITVALDDFGTGFSMIAYLTQFPIDKIKLDKYFIQNLEGGGKAEDILKSLIHFVHSIGCKLVAEGVEMKKEADFLIANNCNVHQGYYYDKPLLPVAFDEKYMTSARTAY